MGAPQEDLLGGSSQQSGVVTISTAGRGGGLAGSVGGDYAHAARWPSSLGEPNLRELRTV